MVPQQAAAGGQTPKDLSPHALIQERLPQGSLYPWRMLVCCALLNRTHGRQVRPIYEEMFRRWPTPARLARAGRELERFVRPLGLWRRRARLLRRLSLEWRRPERCAGVGRYALDSHAIFVQGRLDMRPQDGKLKHYLKWRKRHGKQT